MGHHRERNRYLKDGVSEMEFVAMRVKRDQELAEPRLLHPSLQTNIRGGRLPRPLPTGGRGGGGGGGYRLLHLPLKLGGKEW